MATAASNTNTLDPTNDFAELKFACFRVAVVVLLPTYTLIWRSTLCKDAVFFAFEYFL